MESTQQRNLVVIAHTVVAPVNGRWAIKNRVGVLLEELADLGWNVTVVARNAEQFPFMTHLLSPALQVVTVPAELRGQSLRGFRRIAHTLRQADEAIVFMPSLMCAVLGSLLGPRAIVYAGASWELRAAPRWRVILETLLARRARHVVTAGDAVAARFRKTGTPTTVCVPHVEPEVVERMREPSGLPKQYDALRLLYVGSLSAAKGTPELIEALRRLPAIPCRVVGEVTDGDPRLRRSLETLPNVRVEDYLDWPDLRERYEWATALVLPSHSEGFPRVVHEATAFGAASILTPVGGIPGRLRNNLDALIVPVGEVEALTEALNSLAERPAHLADLAEGARLALAPMYADGSPGLQFDRILRRR